MWFSALSRVIKNRPSAWPCVQTLNNFGRIRLRLCGMRYPKLQLFFTPPLIRLGTPACFFSLATRTVLFPLNFIKKKLNSDQTRIMDHHLDQFLTHWSYQNYKTDIDSLVFSSLWICLLSCCCNFMRFHKEGYY